MLFKSRLLHQCFALREQLDSFHWLYNGVDLHCFIRERFPPPRLISHFLVCALHVAPHVAAPDQDPESDPDQSQNLIGCSSSQAVSTSIKYGQ